MKRANDLKGELLEDHADGQVDARVEIGVADQALLLEDADDASAWCSRR